MPHHLLQLTCTQESWAAAAAFSIMVSASGAARAVKTTPLMATADALEARKKAGAAGTCRPPS